MAGQSGHRTLPSAQGRNEGAKGSASLRRAITGSAFVRLRPPKGAPKAAGGAGRRKSVSAARAAVATLGPGTTAAGWVAAC